MALGWSIAGKRIEFRAGFPAGKLVVADAPKGPALHELKMKAKGEWELPVAGRTYRVVRAAGMMGPKIDLFSPRGELVPPSAKHLSPSPAPAGAVCATHAQAAAVSACARCGTFLCAECQGADLTHCRACLGGLEKAAKAEAAAMAYFAPVLIFAVVGGLLGGLFGGAAGAAAVAVARKAEKTPVKIAAAVAFYGVAAVAWIIAVAVLRG